MLAKAFGPLSRSRQVRTFAETIRGQFPAMLVMSFVKSVTHLCKTRLCEMFVSCVKVPVATTFIVLVKASGPCLFATRGGLSSLDCSS